MNCAKSNFAIGLPSSLIGLINDKRYGIFGESRFNTLIVHFSIFFMTTISITTVVIFLKATKAKSQNRISLKQQLFLKNDKSESFSDF